MKARRLAAQATMAAKSPAEKAERAAKISKGLKEVWAEYGLQIEAKRSATRAARTPEQVAQLSQTLSTAQKGYHSKRREERALMSKNEYGATKLRRGKYTQERIDKIQAGHAARPPEERAESLARGVLKSQAQKAVKDAAFAALPLYGQLAIKAKKKRERAAKRAKREADFGE